jgi:queuosine precursor transporter
MKRLLIFVAFAATIPAANWLIGHVGTECIPDGPCLIPVGFGLMAPSGVLMIGLALVLRDALHEEAGPLWALAAVLAGGLLSLAVAPPTLAFASAAAFTLAELADLAVYAPLRRRGRHVAVLASGAVGAVVDSLLFTWMAFGTVEWAAGIVIGKLYASVAVAAFLAAQHRAKEVGDA